MAKRVYLDRWSMERFFGAIFIRGLDRYRRTAVFDRMVYQVGAGQDYVFVCEHGTYRAQPWLALPRSEWDLR